MRIYLSLGREQNASFIVVGLTTRRNNIPLKAKKRHRPPPPPRVSSLYLVWIGIREPLLSVCWRGTPLLLFSVPRMIVSDHLRYCIKSFLLDSATPHVGFDFHNHDDDDDHDDDAPWLQSLWTVGCTLDRNK